MGIAYTVFGCWGMLWTLVSLIHLNGKGPQAPVPVQPQPVPVQPHPPAPQPAAEVQMAAMTMNYAPVVVAELGDAPICDVSGTLATATVVHAVKNTVQHNDWAGGNSSSEQLRLANTPCE